MKKALWRQWRGKTKLREMKDQVPKEIDKIERRLNELEEKIMEYKKRKSVQLRKKEMRKDEWERKHRMIGQNSGYLIY